MDAVGLGAVSLVSDLVGVRLVIFCELCVLVGAAGRSWLVFVGVGRLVFGLGRVVVGVGGCFGCVLGVVDADLRHGRSHCIALVRDLVLPAGVFKGGLCGVAFVDGDVDCVLLQCSVCVW